MTQTVEIKWKSLEFDMDEVPWLGEFFTEPLQIEKGVLVLSEKPGWGMDVDEEGYGVFPYYAYALESWHRVPGDAHEIVLQADQDTKSSVTWTATEPNGFAKHWYGNAQLQDGVRTLGFSGADGALLWSAPLDAPGDWFHASSDDAPPCWDAHTRDHDADTRLCSAATPSLDMPPAAGAPRSTSGPKQPCLTYIYLSPGS